ncbi:MAG: cupin domain-containing protein [Opitutales bacterium]|nr:cupin domain-containing protein [Opitutales bacterium]
MDNFFDIQNLPRGQEKIEVLAQSGGLRVERIASNCAASPEGFWYDQPENERVWVLRGEAELEFEGGAKTLRAGEGLFIKKHVRHRVKSTSECCVWLAIFENF